MPPAEDPTLDQLLSTQLLFFVLGILALCFVIRKAFETIWPTLTKHTPLSRAECIWESFILPTMPMIVGANLAAFIIAYPFPAGMGATWATRAMFGAGCGFTSGWFYDIMKGIIEARWNVKLSNNGPSAPPPPDVPSTPEGL